MFLKQLPHSLCSMWGYNWRSTLVIYSLLCGSWPSKTPAATLTTIKYSTKVQITFEIEAEVSVAARIQLEVGGGILILTQPPSPTAHSKPAAPEKSLHMLCSMLPHIVAVYNKVQELSGNLLDHLKSHILSCNMLYLTLISWTYGPRSHNHLLRARGSMMQFKMKSALLLSFMLYTHSTCICMLPLHATLTMEAAKLTSVLS